MIFKRQLLIYTLFAATSIHAQTFDDFLQKLRAASEDARQAKVDLFMQSVNASPLAEDTLAHFIYSGQGSKLGIGGDFSGWNPANAPMTNIAGTDFWYRTEVFHNAARLDYKLVIDEKNWILDPRNPHRAPSGMGENSELRMPEYASPPEIEYLPEIPHGMIIDTTFTSANLNNSRPVKIYLPPNYAQSSENYPLVLVHDGPEYISLAKMNNVLDFLIYEKRIPSVIAVFVPPVKRTPEYVTNKQGAFTRFIVEEVVPWAEEKFRVSADPAQRAVIGSSYGGNISLWQGMKHPEIFGNIGAFSSYVESDIQAFFEKSPKLNLRIYMNHGVYDHLSAIHESVERFVPVLKTKRYDYEYAEYPEGHSYGFWRSYLDDALTFFFGKVDEGR